MKLAKDTRSSRPGAALAAAFVTIVAASAAAAQDSQLNKAPFSGVWKLAGDPQEEQQRRQAIEAASQSFPEFARPIARERLGARTLPPGELILEVDDDHFSVSNSDNRVSLRFDGKPVTVKRNGKRGALSVRLEGERIVVLGEGNKGKRVTTYALSQDRRRMTISVRMSGGRLRAPLVYRSTYSRK